MNILNPVTPIPAKTYSPMNIHGFVSFMKYAIP